VPLSLRFAVYPGKGPPEGALPCLASLSDKTDTVDTADTTDTLYFRGPVRTAASDEKGDTSDTLF
jgi:hypothetical protein